MKKQQVIAIDGPSGSGKSTCARTLASKLGLLYIDTGAMYRALGYWANKENVNLEDSEKLRSFLKGIQIEYGKEGSLIKIDGQDLTEVIRKHEVSKLASIISQIPMVREFLVDFQRTLPEDNVCVMEGRDIGSVVFPQAFCKFFITISTEQRAQRRLKELEEKGQEGFSFEQVKKDIEERDQLDKSRAHSPLIQTEDSILIKNEKSLEETVAELTGWVQKKASEYEIVI